MTLQAEQIVGPFRLSEKIGLGGMGEVWKAHHRAHQTPVAIKVVTSERATEERYRALFQREVQAVAALNHPGVVAVFDYGIVEQLDGTAALPWYAMELAAASLGDIEVQNWAELHQILFEILDALAHAHARGVVHRDLKPGNVLLTEEREVRLTDFGMAHVVEVADRTGKVFGPGGGTPDFMSPEQFRGEWRKFGPWTDLYALGCVAWALVTGHPPFRGQSVIELAMMHTGDPAPELEPRFEVPQRFDRWLRRLLQKHPLDRYRRAADAQWALVNEVGGGPGGRPAKLRKSASNPARRTAESHEPAGSAPLALDTLEELRGETLQTSYGLTPPFPERWRGPERNAQFGGAGLGLFGIREIPYVGRASERDRVWSLLREVDSTNENRIVLVSGEPGVGRTRFAHWVAGRADELGAATVIRATHTPIQSLRDGIGGALGRFLGIDGVDVQRARDIVLDLLGPTFDPRPLLDVLYPARDESASTATFAAPTQRFRVVEKMLRHLSLERPVIFVADDVHWGADTLMFLQHLLETDTRTLVIATVRPDVLPDRFLESQLFGEVAAHERSSEVALSPLPVSERLSLVLRMLDIEKGLARKVALRSQGIPLFAVQLVGDWVQRGLLEEGPAGFRLTPGAKVELPDDVYALWNQRIDELQSSLKLDGVREMLEAAALLGRGDDEEWTRVCAGLGLEVPPALTQALVSRRLASRDKNGWTFQHGMLREALERSATESGRLLALYEACAEYSDQSDPFRRAEFQVRAGRYDSAIDSLLVALRRGLSSVSPEQSLQLVGIITDLFHERKAPSSDPRRGALLEAEVTILRLAGNDELAMARARELVDRAERFGWRASAGEANVHLGSLGQRLGVANDDVLRHFDEALSIFDELDDDVGRGKAYQGLAGLHVANGRPQIASNLLLKAMQVLEDDDEGLVECEIAMGIAKLSAGQQNEAAGWFKRAHDQAVVGGFRHYQAEALDWQGTVSCRQGALESAEREYRGALDLWLDMGSPSADVAAVHLALVHLQRHEYDPAGEILDVVSGRVESGGPLPQVGGVFCAGMMAVAANRGDEKTFDRCHDRLVVGVRDRKPSHDADIGTASFLAGDVWARRNDRRRARASYDVARSHFLALGEQRRADDVARAIGRLGK